MRGFVFQCAVVLPIWAVLCAPLSAEEPSRRALVDEVVAVVEGRAVLRSELAGLQESLQRQGDVIDDTRSLLERKIEDLLIAAQADSLGIRMGEKQIDETVRGIAEQNGMTPDQLYTAVAEQGLNVTDYRRLLADQMLRMQIVQREIEPMIVIDQADLIAHIKSHPDKYAQPPRVTLKFLSQTEAFHGLVTETLMARPDVEVAWQNLDEPIREWVVREAAPGSVGRFEREADILWVALVRLHPAESVALESIEDEVYDAVRRAKIERAFQFWLADLKADAWVERFLH